jgi:hypothetical protein
MSMADPQKYHDHAAELRAEAEETPDPALRLAILEIAALYENLANRLAKQRKAK